jgi:hypothetical protein
MTNPGPDAPLRSRGERGSVGRRRFAVSGVVLEAPALVAGLDDVAVVREPIEQRSGHFGVVEHARHSPKARLMVTTIEVLS